MQIPDARLRIPRDSIVELVGEVMDERGRDYADRGMVASWAWRPERASVRREPATGTLTARVRGSEHSSYEARVVLADAAVPAGGVPGESEWRPSSSSCTCPVQRDCTHVAAVLHAASVLPDLDGSGARDEEDDESFAWSWPHAGRARPASNARAALGQPPLLPEQSWRTQIGELIGAGEARANVQLALGVDVLAQQGPFGYSRFDSRAATFEELQSAHDYAGLAVALRPLQPGKREPWIRGGLTWRTFRAPTPAMQFPAAQREALSRIVALVLADNPNRYDPGETIRLDDLGSVEAWRSLRAALDAGVALVPLGPLTTVRWGEAAEARLEIRRELPDDTDSDLLVEATVSRGEDAVRSRIPGGRGGFARLDIDGQRAHLEIIPARATVPVPMLPLLARREPLRIPAFDADAFLSEFAPQLRRVVPVESTDAAVVIPEASPPRFVLEVTHATTARGEPTVSLTRSWRYSAPTCTLPLRRDTSVAPASSTFPDRDLETETATLEALAGAWPDAVNDTRRTLVGADAAAFVCQALPRLTVLDGVDVVEHGTRPPIVELSGEPKLRITQVEPARSTDNDWFDLGFEITLGEQYVPFSAVFAALSRGKKAVLLPDKTFARLDHPVFDRLRELIAEAETMGEWEPEHPRIGHYDVTLWEDFEDLADETVEAVAWRESVGALRHLDRIPSVDPPAGLDATLRDYQRDGLNWLAWLHQHELGGILADDMGLGKTLQTLALIAVARQREPSGPPFLVVAPSSVLGVWRHEAERFAPGLDVRVLDTTTAKRGTSLADAARGADLVVTSYTLVRLGEEEFAALEWSGLVLDEAQFVKNRAAKTHRAAARIRAPFRLAITGTPLENSLTDLWALFSLTAPGLFASARAFREEYVRPIEQSGSEPDSRATASARLARLRRRVRPFLLRRTKALVAAELPPKQEQRIDVPLEPAHRRLYDRVLQRERQKLLGLVDDLDRNRFIVFRSLTLLRMLALDPAIVDPEYADYASSKLDALMEQLPQAVADGHRVIVFSQFTSFLGRIATRLTAAGIAHAYLDGSTRDRDAAVTQFRSGAAPVFLISLKAGGFGLTLTEADYVFVMDPWWNPAAESQAVDRAHRIGQSRTVMVYRMVAAGTIEEKVLALQERKAALFEAFTDGEAAFNGSITAADIRELLGEER